MKRKQFHEGKRPFVSFIIPVYNVQNYLAECIQSVIVQTYKDWEMILIDDGSTDLSLQICNSFADKDRRIKVFSKVNSGVSSARNLGLSKANGIWVFFLDSDDIINVRTVELAHNAVTYNKYVDLIQFDQKPFYNNSIISNTKTENNYLVLSKDQMLLREQSLSNLKFLKLDIIRKYNLKFTETIKLGEDLEFPYKHKMLCSYPLEIKETLYYYRIRQNSATRSSDTRSLIITDTFIILKNLAEFIIIYDVKESMWLDKRIRNMFSLYLAACINESYNKSYVKSDLDKLFTTFDKLNYKYLYNFKMNLCRFSFSIYFILFKIKKMI